MQKLIISLICCLLPMLAVADNLEMPKDAAPKGKDAAPQSEMLREDAPEYYTVKKGDTLWDISAKFLRDPWKWPQVWDLNKDEIKNPHWIYPGDVVVFDPRTRKFKVGGGIEPPPTGPKPPEGGETPPPIPGPDNNGRSARGDDPIYVTRDGYRLYPRVRIGKGSNDAVPSIPYRDIKPFLNQALVIEEGEFDDLPVIVSGFERDMLSNGDVAYVKRLPKDKGQEWQVYRAGNALVDPADNRVLGHEAVFLGNARVEKFDDVTTARIRQAAQEIHPGDRLIQVPNEFPENFVPRAPDNDVDAHVIKIVNGITMGGQKAVVVINRGRRDGLQNGHVLALFHKGAKVNGEKFGLDDMHMPDVRYGLLFVFRTFNRVSYGVVIQSRMPVEMLDLARTP